MRFTPESPQDPARFVAPARKAKPTGPIHKSTYRHEGQLIQAAITAKDASELLLPCDKDYGKCK